ncbi:MAG: phosphoribosylaminoimidazolesuccinocarboxamide synthase [Thermomicrobiales bacterium]
MIQAVRETLLDGLPLYRRGKVRDTYDLGESLLMVASDRISAYDVVLPSTVPLKGAILTQISRFWFRRTSELVPNHLITADVREFPPSLHRHADQLRGRGMIVRKAERIDIECVVRGFLAGSAWAEYSKLGTVCGEKLRENLHHAERLPEPLFTPAIKNDSGHDENISPAALANLVGPDLALNLELASRMLYQAAADVASRHGIIVADTKFEFGWIDGELILIDEMVTPDSSRFWDAGSYEPGHDQPSFDKQYVRDWLTSVGWDKQSPGPELPPDVIAGTARRYHEAFKRLTGSTLRLDS